MAINERVAKAITKMISGLEGSHGGYEGPSLAEKLRDDLDDSYENFKENLKAGVNDQYEVGLVDGIAHAIGVIRSSSREYELEQAEERYTAGRTQDVGAERSDTP